jgi:hypothetical protein
VNLIVDVGTNAEIVLGNRERLLAASSPTGPAFEGAQISCGQRAAPGAIERVRIDPETLEPRIRAIGSDAWSDEPGFADVHVTGVCGSGIIEAIAELHLAGVLTTDGTIDGSLATRSSRVVADGHLLRAWEGSPSRDPHHDVGAIRSPGPLSPACTLDGALRDRARWTDPLCGSVRTHIDQLYCSCRLVGLRPARTAAGNAAARARASHS